MKKEFLVFFLILGSVAMASAEWNKGLQAYKSRAWATAVSEFKEVTRTNPDYAGGYYMLGVSQRALGQISPAIASLRKAVKLDGTQSSYKIALGQAFLQADQYQNAYELLQPIGISSFDGAQRSNYALLFAQAATKTNRESEAISVLTAQAKADPNNARLQKALGAAYNQSGDDSRAFAAFTRAFELDPKDQSSGRNAVRAGIVAARRSSSNLQKAQLYTSTARVAERLANGFPTFDHQLIAGEAWLGAKDYGKAEAWFGKAKAQQSSNALVYFYTAQCKTSTNQLDEALGDLQEALDLGPSAKVETQIYNQAGYVCEKKGDIPAAVDWYKKAENTTMVARLSAELEPENLPKCPGFRETTWGMTRSQVISIEGTPEHSEGSSIGYSGELAGESAFIFFEFVDNQLARGSYLLGEEHVFKNNYIDDYNKFKDLLTTKYGSPLADSVNWENDLYRDDPGEWGIAVSLGHLGFNSTWLTDKTEIMIVLGGGNYEANLMISYVSRELSDDIADAKKEEQLSGL